MSSVLTNAILTHMELVREQSEAVLREARDKLGGRVPDAAGLAGLVAGALHGVGQVIERVWEFGAMAGDQRKPGCRMGCSSCCYQEVVVTTSELVMLAVAIPEEERARVAARATLLAARAAGGGPEARYRAAIPCVFLERNVCGIYERRPQVCVTHYSFSRPACLREWNARRLKPEVRAQRNGVPMPTLPKALGFAVMAGVDAALHELGLEVEVVELSEALPTILEPGAVERWLAGERLFSRFYRGHGVDEAPYPTLLEGVLAQAGKAVAA